MKGIAVVEVHFRKKLHTPGQRDKLQFFYFRKAVKIMDVQVIGQLVASLGFPIVASGALFWFVNKQEERHKEEIEGVRQTLEDNTQVLTSLKELIQVIIKKEDE